MLGEIPGVFSAGELTHIWSFGFIANHLCACGEPFDACPLWTAVTSAAFPAGGARDPQDMVSLHKAVERHRHLLKLVSSRMLQRDSEYAAALSEYRTALSRLYQAIWEVSGDDVIVDSSKDPLHAFILRNMPEVELSVVHLIRDSRGVAHSWERKRVRPEVLSEVRHMPTYGPWHSAVEWNRTNLLLRSFRRPASRYARVRYEDLVAQPTQVLGELLAQLLGRHDALEFVSDHKLTLSTRHTVAGNPMRFTTGELQLVQDDAWKHEMGRAKRLAVAALTAPGLWRYGYLSK